MKESQTHHISALLKGYFEWQIRVTKVLDGVVDMTIQGWYIGDKITPEQKQTLIDIALRFCASEMWELREELRLLGAPFTDGVTNVLELVQLLREEHGQRIADAAEARKKGG